MLGEKDMGSVKVVRSQRGQHLYFHGEPEQPIYICEYNNIIMTGFTCTCHANGVLNADVKMDGDHFHLLPTFSLGHGRTTWLFTFANHQTVRQAHCTSPMFFV